MPYLLKAKIIDPITGQPNVLSFVEQAYIDQQLQLALASKISSISGTANQIIVTGTTTTPVLSLGAELQALTAFMQTGLISRTGSATYASRTITASTGISVLNGDGISGNPIISISTIPIGNLSGYPNNENYVLKGNATWSKVDIRNDTTGYLDASQIPLPMGVFRNNAFYKGDGFWQYVDLANSVTGLLPISKLSGYPANSYQFLRGDGNWVNLPSINIDSGTFDQLNISRLKGYPYNSSLFLRGDGTWATPSSSMSNINNLPINGNLNLYSYGLTTYGDVNAQTGTLIANNLAAHSSSSIYCQSPLSNLKLGSNFSLNGYRITETSGSSLFFSSGTLEIQGGLVGGRNYSYGWLNRNGMTGMASGTNFYSLVCSDRIAASEFNATSSKKIKNIECNANYLIQDLKNKFLELNFYKYFYIDEQDGRGEHYGIIAEDLARIFPQFVDLERKRYVPNCVDNKGKMLKAIFEYAKDDVLIFSCKLDLTRIDKNSQLIKLLINNCFYEVKIKKITFSKLEVIVNKDDLSNINNYLVKGYVVYIYGTYEKCPTVEKNKLAEIGLILLQDLIRKTDYLKEK